MDSLEEQRKKKIMQIARVFAEIWIFEGHIRVYAIRKAWCHYFEDKMSDV